MIDGSRAPPKGPPSWRQALHIALGDIHHTLIHYWFGRHEIVTFGTADTNKLQVKEAGVPESMILFETRPDKVFVLNFHKDTPGWVVPYASQNKVYLRQAVIQCQEGMTDEWTATELGNGLYQLPLPKKIQGWFRIGSVTLRFECFDLGDISSEPYIH